MAEERVLTEVVIVDGVRSPVGRFGGGLASVRPDDLAALVLRQLIARNPVEAAGNTGRPGLPARRGGGGQLRRFDHPLLRSAGLFQHR